MDLETMIRGLVRAAEMKEQDGSGVVWDDQVRLSLEAVRALGWGRDRVGTLPKKTYEKPVLTELSIWTRDDQPLPEDDAITAALPTHSGSGHDIYAEAMRLVGAKRSKGALVALVNWLLIKRKKKS